jgi:casein kinase II subunit beta
MSRLVSLSPFYNETTRLTLAGMLAEEESHRVPDVSIVESSAELLYGLIHQRFIITRQGLQQMVRHVLSSPPLLR